MQFDNLKALIINTSLKRASADSHTQRLLSPVGDLMAAQGVAVEHLHMLDHDVPPGVSPDMRKEGWSTDDWPDLLWPKVREADILVIGTPLWLGEESSICRILIERLYAMSGELNDKGQSSYYGKVAGCVITGNEDGIKHTAMTLTFALNHLGYTIPPQADCGWIGEAGPGASFGDVLEDGSRAGYDNAFTRRNATIMTWNLMHLAKLLKGGIPNEGNDRNAFAAGERFGFRLGGDQ
ncbi:flavodoxin family protein [Paracoccus caeni]|uniref:Flavodoxin family protein n=1 Tax=Paracoccus caeni TaxID=657651 RepID=A0A934SI75_9RHOB|nr:NAD(P)H-dependent oxidoreductase [Paracoccus caeni]MBK4215842.1 flavodoxin family protein [Paracoccus caeni]